ncbi:putative C6 transcription factor [Xylogone sp. PMI_703]|nr:putative C6 transcription factor [Xylogone sp. PMI_703]
MSFAGRSRVTKRMHQACENCRRKKTRCPGERPACSTCTRLHQVCCYSGRDVQSRPESDLSPLEGRLAQLEEKMELVLERAVSDTLPPKDIILEAIQLYFQFCHRQPLWLFERNDLNPPVDRHPEELIFSLLALSTREIARSHIMLKIGQGAIQLSTIQSLCLLAFANFVARDTHLAWLHIGLATSLSRCADMDVERHNDNYSPAVEAKRRIFYSIHLLNNLYAPRSMTLNLLGEIEKPRYVGTKRDLSWEFSKPPPLTAREFVNETQTSRSGIWTYMIQQSSLWREVRNYIAHCADGNPKPPWAPDSEYAVIGAHLMDLETRFPTYYRYDAARFSEHSTEELQRSREFWSPWLYLQFTYHAIHNVLNHPFLYSSRPNNNSITMTVPNTFWKTSSEMAFIHSSWTVRLVDMVIEKEYQISDPFIGYTVAIAATIHLYYCRTVDSRVRSLAQTKLAKCIKFVEELGAVWPVCRSMYQRLEELVQSAFHTNKYSGEVDVNVRTVSINTALMWSILDYTSFSKQDQKLGRGLFDPAFVQGQDEDEDDEQTVETQIFHRPMGEVDTSDGGQELPPYSDLTIRRNPRRTRYYSAPAEERSSSLQQQSQHNSSFMDVPQDLFFQQGDHASPYFLGFWDNGNL